MVLTLKSQEIGIRFTITDCSNFDKQSSSAHFCLSYFITTVMKWAIKEFQNEIIDFGP